MCPGETPEAIPQQPNTQRLLLVDDDSISREVLALLATAAGYEVQAAESGDEALHLLQSGTPVDAVLTDLQMPGTSGEPLAHALRAICPPGTRIIAMSASGQGYPAYDGFLRKPFEMEELAALLSPDPAPSPTPQAEALDQAVLDKLTAAMGESQRKALYAMCLDDAARRTVRLRSSAEAGDNTAFIREAHALRGGCAVVGAVELTQLAAGMEESGLMSGTQAVNSTLDQFLVACDRLRRILDAQQS